MVVLRFLALIIFVIALLLLGADIFGILESDAGWGFDQFRSIESAWGTVHPDSLESAGGNVPGVLLGLPASLTLGVVGLVLAILFRRRD